MSIRLSLFWIFVITMMIYAWKDWFVSLCGLIVLMAVLEHPDMPKSIMGIQGLNLWNILMASILIAWFIQRRAQGLRWDMPRFITLLLILYLLVVVVGFFRAFLDRSYIEDYPTANLISEELVNTIKWVIPGILVFDGCRSKQRLKMVIFSILLLYALFAAQVVISVPLRGLTRGKGITTRTRLKIKKRMGYQPVDMSTIMAGAGWAMLTTLGLFKKWRYKIVIIAAAILSVVAQAVTGGRAGYAAWAMVGIILCILRWRKFLLLAPIILFVFASLMPGTVSRIEEGFGQVNPSGGRSLNEYKISSGRFEIWPYVIEKIEKSPMLGYGRLAMRRTGLAYKLRNDFNENFPHPHNAYLEWILDNGILGLLPIAVFFFIVVLYSTRLFIDKSNIWYAVAGGVSLSLVLAQLIAAMGSQHFYPREGTLGMWCAIFLMFRMYLIRKQELAQHYQYSAARIPQYHPTKR